ncbi:MAG: hypothetical protein COT71_02565 [Candidatus Andersenbacteria bacterium CG10_big_fil_rev_8_21_14_0_10_54_11]|uniref:Glycosyltransferase RgtA/B/C/D-like domain-containing protein n=1 Tax=Candidatus Andersenbacteria bacterium CG10_big_fil_rev_8_21_14_0_10_54_11 TaxID=1974485 RepID=A0A2M6WZ81_9BACT|nr:MAG: hypothetical protein COT71_02565 [Candidatus Andersenbacteria bacterium CG10_big_fil_rev_8_21_14_0_10_54_11]
MKLKIEYRWPLFLSFVFFGFLIGALRQLDPDFGWHVQAGRYISEYGLPRHDVFTYTARNFRWINHEWLHDVLVAQTYRLGGYNLLAVLFAALWTVSIRLAAGNKHSLVIPAIAVIALLPQAGVRPAVWSVIGVLVMARLIASYVSRPQIGTVLLIGALLALWANLHGSFILGLLMLIAHTAVRKDRSALMVLAVAAVATLLNPYGPGLYEEVWRTAFDHELHWHIREWWPLLLPFPVVAYSALFFSCFWLAEPRKVHAAVLLPGAAFLLALSGARHAPIFVALSLQPFESYRQTVRQKMDIPSLSIPQKRVRRALQAMIAIVIVAAAINAVIPWRYGWSVYPWRSVAYLRTHPCPGNLFNDYNIGGFLVWQLPGQPVYIDGRMPSWPAGNTTYFSRYLAVRRSAAERNRQFTEYNIRCVLTKQAGAVEVELERRLDFISDKIYSKDIAAPLQADGWHVVMRESGYVLLMKE